MILFAENLGVQATGAGFQLVATVPIAAGMLLQGVLRWNITGRRTSETGTSNLRARIGGADLLANGVGDSGVNIYNRANASCPPGITNNLRANGFTSRSGANPVTGLALVNLNDALDLTFDVDLGTDTDVYTFDELTVEYLPPSP